jgi:hypothetical protein
VCVCVSLGGKGLKPVGEFETTKAEKGREMYLFRKFVLFGYAF